jgi:hypothetical protein
MVTCILCGSFLHASDVILYFPFYGVGDDTGDVIL